MNNRDIMDTDCYMYDVDYTGHQWLSIAVLWELTSYCFEVLSSFDLIMLSHIVFNLLQNNCNWNCNWKIITEITLGDIAV